MEVDVEIPKSRIFFTCIGHLTVLILMFHLLDELTIFIQAQQVGAIHSFKIGYFPEWVKAIVIFLNCVVSTVLILIYVYGKLPLKLLLIIYIVNFGVFAVWGLIESTSCGSIERGGISYQSPSTGYKIQRLSWPDFENAAFLEIVDRTYRGRVRLVGILNIRAIREQEAIPFNISFSYNQHKDRQDLIEVLRLLKENNIQVTTHFHYMARYQINRRHDEAMNENYINKLKTLTYLEEL